AARYGWRRAERTVWSWLRHVHGLAKRNLAPSRRAMDDLRRNGVQRVAQWPRGVDLMGFHPDHRDAGLRAPLAPDGQLLGGYIGRLAHEKEIELLASLQHDPDVRVVIVGDGPQRRQLEQRLPAAAFLGFQSGLDLATTFASLDVFVHPGSHE